MNKNFETFDSWVIFLNTEIPAPTPKTINKHVYKNETEC